VVKLVGVKHVGIGSDFDGVGDSLPVGLKDVSQYHNLVAELLRRGYSDADVGLILGGNLLRVWKAVEAEAE
jgi:membrane dipeptidase